MQKSIRPKTKRWRISTACGPQQYFDVDKTHWLFMQELTTHKKTRQNPLVIPVRTRTREKVDDAKAPKLNKSENVQNQLVFVYK